VIKENGIACTNKLRAYETLSVGGYCCSTVSLRTKPIKRLAAQYGARYAGTPAMQSLGKKSDFSCSELLVIKYTPGELLVIKYTRGELFACGHSEEGSVQMPRPEASITRQCERCVVSAHRLTACMDGSATKFFADALICEHEHCASVGGDWPL
jgi:hypothetical protein